MYKFVFEESLISKLKLVTVTIKITILRWFYAHDNNELSFVQGVNGQSVVYTLLKRICPLELITNCNVYNFSDLIFVINYMWKIPEYPFSWKLYIIVKCIFCITVSKLSWSCETEKCNHWLAFQY